MQLVWFIGNQKVIIVLFNNSSDFEYETTNLPLIILEINYSATAFTHRTLFGANDMQDNIHEKKMKYFGFETTFGSLMS